MGHNKLTSFPSELGYCRSLNYLSFRNNSLTLLPNSITQLTNLETLFLLYNNISYLPTDFKLSKFPELAILDFQYNSIDYLPDDFFEESSKFQELFACHNHLSTIPQSISLCTSITTLDFKKNRIDSFPSISNLFLLSTLNLASNLLHYVPEGLDKVTSLKSLNLFGNYITSLPSITTLTLLHHLHLSYNLLTSLGPLPNSPHLLTCSISSLPFQTPLPSFLTCPHVESLYLNNLNLQSVPSEITYLRFLTQLDLSHNKLTFLPPILGRLRGLYILDVSHNLLRNGKNEDFNTKNTRWEGEGWDKFGWWTGLENIAVIDLSWNRMVECPFGLQELVEEKGVEVVLDHNPMRNTLDYSFFDPRLTGKYNLGWADMVGLRESQEDCFLIKGILREPYNDELSIFGLFDGHVSRAVAQFAAVHFSEHLLSHLSLDDPLMSPIKSLKKAFYTLNANWHSVISTECADTDADQTLAISGTTGAVALFMNNHIYVANIGDSRVVLFNGFDYEVEHVSDLKTEDFIPYVQRLSVDHKPDTDEEEQRIRELGGYVVNGRIGGILGVSRGLGDFYLYPLVSSKAFAFSVELPEHPDAFLLICCDGVWDELSDEEAALIVYQSMKEKEDVHHAAMKLRDYAFSLGSDDNISTMIVKWNTV
eukprot:TRINITY_DN231_c1_g1_i1.p1 TRINITY_DN231_c1_g1~~TRINITY_DN231_c1_g1_i1.p1  ORF type:complete len:703 (+),score=164.63 TRINITY_DN231_c1_g1_i1:162-2111(+)